MVMAETVSLARVARATSITNRERPRRPQYKSITRDCSLDMEPPLQGPRCRRAPRHSLAHSIHPAEPCQELFPPCPQRQKSIPAATYSKTSTVASGEMRRTSPNMYLSIVTSPTHNTIVREKSISG